MTYCVAAKINDGIVFCSDSRTNGSIDQVGHYSKLHRFPLSDDREIFILSAGNLGITQSVIQKIRTDLSNSSGFNLSNANCLSEVADYLGQINVKIQNKYLETGPTNGFDASVTFILGGQIKGEEHDLYLVYPEGNHICPPADKPFLQIGETKYGRPVLERIIRRETVSSTAMLCLLVSMESTLHNNLSVGPPIELLYFEKNNFTTNHLYFSFEDGNQTLKKLSILWDEKIREAIASLPWLTEIDN